MPIKEQLLAKAEWQGECLVWTGARSRGYGHLYVDGAWHPAHRLAWVAEHGPIPSGLFVLHRCDNRPCFNIEHLFLGTQADNLADMDAKGRRVSWNKGKTHCIRGHPLSGENLMLRPREGKRKCRICHRAQVQRWKLEHT
jgi:hypothetical protein